MEINGGKWDLTNVGFAVFVVVFPIYLRLNNGCYVPSYHSLQCCYDCSTVNRRDEY